MGQGRARRGAALLCAVALGAAACSPAEEGAGPRPAAAGGVDVGAADRADLEPGGTLEWGINEFPAQWNPHHADGNLATVRTVTDAVLPTPFEVDPEEGPRPDPDYLLGAEVREAGPDRPQTVTLRLNPEARWSDGTPITWRDYRATADALDGRGDGYRVRGEVGYDRIARVRQGADEYEAVVEFSEPFSEYPSLFAPLLPESVAGDPEAFNEDFTGDIPVTAGPFEVAGVDDGARRVELRRSEDWWGDPAVLDGIVFTAMDQEGLDSAFLDGGIDAYALPVDAGSFGRANSAGDGEVRVALGPDYRHITLNGQSPLLRDRRVRHAVFLGVNRQALTDAALSGLGMEAEPLGNHFLLEGQPGFTDNSGEWGRHDPERAAALLDEAGWKPGEDGIREKDGERLELRFLVPRGFRPGQDEAEMVQAMLGEAGIGVDIEQVGGDELFSRYVLPGDYDMVAFVNTGGRFPISNSLPQWASPVEGPDGEEWRSNVGRIASKEIDAAMDDALETLDEEESLRAVNRADKALWEEGHTLPLYQRPQLMAVRSDLANIGAPGFGSYDYEDIGYLKG
ncbi:ABC transporter family substrate-binding protein [Nocardiopsis sp. RSe5-2]|uniref:ABC transporter family substrate-binding protein n=1 Tax=Nocardiopsis endophytica TaxID=3018445 RepID=A0ABT4U594_9ACTN|nr:ABC transporter family substrate-binding protein [Nocardiopsis endophytica]MDA2812114.1 ABC transporter family substrate-binding protein [Nocardiopsis endophytica]